MTKMMQHPAERSLAANRPNLRTKATMQRENVENLQREIRAVGTEQEWTEVAARFIAGVAGGAFDDSWTNRLACELTSRYPAVLPATAVSSR